MDVLNETAFVARVIRADIDRGNAVSATLVVKATFQRDDRGSLVPAGDPMPYVDERLVTPFGIFHTDTFVRKDGVDVCVLGTVRTDSPVREARVTLTAGALRSELRVVGARRWMSGGTRLVPSEPAPFTELPLAYSRAYGGATEHDDERFVWADNPAGRGYYLSEEKALGQPLPQIEPGGGALVREWTDRPEVAGWGPYPFSWGLRAREGIDVSEVTADNPVPRFKPRLYNHAHPSLITSELPPGSGLRIEGMRRDDVVFSIPHVRPVAEVSVGDHRLETEGLLDGAFVWVDAERLTLTYRAHFLYPYRSGERRTLRLRDAAPANGR